MNKRSRKIFRILAIVAVIYTFFGPPFWYYGRETEFRVVDAATGKPLEVVIVVAHWELAGGGLGGRVPIGQLEIMETQSDKNGRVYFPSWGPRIAFNGEMDEISPGLLFFKPGYRPFVTHNKFGGLRQVFSRIRSSDWSGKKVALRRHNGDASDYAEGIRHYSTMVYSATLFDQGAVKKIKKTVASLSKEQKKLKEIGIDVVLETDRFSRYETGN